MLGNPRAKLSGRTGPGSRSALGVSLRGILGALAHVRGASCSFETQEILEAYLCVARQLEPITEEERTLVANDAPGNRRFTSRCVVPLCRDRASLVKGVGAGKSGLSSGSAASHPISMLAPVTLTG